MSEELQRLTILIPTDAFERLRSMAYSQHRSMSALGREALEAYIDQPIPQPQHGGVRHKAVKDNEPPDDAEDHQTAESFRRGQYRPAPVPELTYEPAE